jgi:6-phosphogluconolactonase
LRHDQPVADVHVIVDEDAVGRAAAEIATRLRAAVDERGEASLAVSGGSTGAPLLAALAADALPWEAIETWQVDERVAPDGDPDRNANQLRELPGQVWLMPVTADDLRGAADTYAAGLPERFDVVHLGMGPDGHTASWPPGDPVIDSTRPVDLSHEYQGRVRMTLTPPVIDAARWRVVLVTGADKADAAAEWLQGPRSALPVERVPIAATTVVLDPGAASRLDPSPAAGE